MEGGGAAVPGGGRAAGQDAVDGLPDSLQTVLESKPLTQQKEKSRRLVAVTMAPGQVLVDVHPKEQAQG